MTPGAQEIDLLLQDAEAKLASAKLEHGAKAANLPVFLLMGDPGSSKTTVMLHCGLEPELLAGQTYTGGNVTPTKTANVWYSQRSLFIEAAGGLPASPASWNRLVKKLQPRGSAITKGAQAPRAAVVFFDSDNFNKSGMQDLVLAAGRAYRAKLGELSESMGINLPVYVVFAKMDRVPFFAEFVRNLTLEESGQVVGVTLPILTKRSAGSYGDEETARVTGQFERLFRALADARPELLTRESDASKLPAAYEFPREFRKLVTACATFMVELCRPSQITVGPFLRGFYFTGVRPIVVNEQQPSTPLQPRSGSAATGIFGMGAGAQAQPAAPIVGSARKVPQWVFLGSLFKDVLLADQAARDASGASARVSGPRRILLGAAAALCLLLAIVFTVSFIRNRGLETRVNDARRAIQAGAAGGDAQSLDSLKKLDALRQELVTLSTYHREGAPLTYRMGLYIGEELYPEARRTYFDRFKQALFGQTQDGILRELRTLPVTAGPDYGPTYNALKAYLITTSHHDKSTKEFLSPVLMQWWTNGRAIDADRLQLAQKQFDFYADELRLENPYASDNDAIAVQRARRYLAQFNGVERVYAFMLAEAGKSNPPVNFNRQFPGSEQTVVEAHEVAGAFSRGGWNFMKDAIAHAERYFGGEPWVLGDQGNAAIDRSRLEQDLKARYYGDFIKEWRAYIKSANVVRYAGLKDAAQKLSQLSADRSTLLQLFALATQNTAVDDPTVAGAFRSVHAVVPENSTTPLAPPNQDYIGALAKLQRSIDAISSQKVPEEGAASATLAQAGQARNSLRAMAGTFGQDAEAHIETNVQKLLDDPIVYAEALLRTLGPGELNAKARILCGQFRAVMAKYPFNPGATPEATVPDVNGLFRKPDGAMWAFYDQNLQKLLTKDGASFVAHPAGGVSLTPNFVSFFNEAARFSDAIYAGGTQDPHLTYTLKPDPSEGIQSTTVRIDGTVLSFSGGTASATKFSWQGTGGHEAKASVKFGGPDLEWSTNEGIWAVFRFFGKAEKWSPVGAAERLEWVVRVGKDPVLLGGKPLTVRYDLEMLGAPPVFQRGYFSHLTCVQDIAR